MRCGFLRKSRILIFCILTSFVFKPYVQFNFIILNTSELAICISCPCNLRKLFNLVWFELVKTFLYCKIKKRFKILRMHIPTGGKYFQFILNLLTTGVLAL